MDNWNEFTRVRTNLSVELPGAHESPSYAATSPGYAVLLIIHHYLLNINL